MPEHDCPIIFPACTDGIAVPEDPGNAVGPTAMALAHPGETSVIRSQFGGPQRRGNRAAAGRRPTFQDARHPAFWRDAPQSRRKFGRNPLGSEKARKYGLSRLGKNGWRVAVYATGRARTSSGALVWSGVGSVILWQGSEPAIVMVLRFWSARWSSNVR
jgi:hypothetical protein